MRIKWLIIAITLALFSGISHSSSINILLYKDAGYEGDWAGVQQFVRYEYFPSNVLWDDAKADCENRGGHLVTLRSSSEENFVNQLSENQRIWIGLHDKNTEGHFEWVTGEPVVYTNWDVDEPNDCHNEWSPNGEDCVLDNWKSDSTRWNDAGCDTWYGYYVCEYPPPEGYQVDEEGICPEGFHGVIEGQQGKCVKD